MFSQTGFPCYSGPVKRRCACRHPEAGAALGGHQPPAVPDPEHRRHERGDEEVLQRAVQSGGADRQLREVDEHRGGDHRGDLQHQPPARPVQGKSRADTVNEWLIAHHGETQIHNWMVHPGCSSITWMMCDWQVSYRHSEWMANSTPCWNTNKIIGHSVMWG